MSHPNERQILVNIGNRYVVFGSAATLPDRRRLGPSDVKKPSARVGDERDHVLDRIRASVIVDNAQVGATRDRKFGDIVLDEIDGTQTLVDIKIGDRDFAGLDLQHAWTLLADSAEVGSARREIWGFNLERLKLGIIWSEGKLSPQFLQFDAIDVWEYNNDGSVFDRRQLIDIIDDWSSRIDRLYADVKTWADREHLAIETSRSVPMSEELNQRFAISDRDLPILDVARGSQPLLSLVPVGLWVIGSNGRIDAITERGTKLLLDQARYPDAPKWVLIDRRSNEDLVPWNYDSFRDLLSLVTAGE